MPEPTLCGGRWQENVEDHHYKTPYTSSSNPSGDFEISQRITFASDKDCDMSGLYN